MVTFSIFRLVLFSEALTLGVWGYKTNSVTARLKRYLPAVRKSSNSEIPYPKLISGALRLPETDPKKQQHEASN